MFSVARRRCCSVSCRGKGSRTMERFLLLVACLVAQCLLTETTSPGLKLKLSQKGLDYAADVAVSKLSGDVKGQSIPDVHGSDRLAVGKVYYDITSIRITDFTRPGSSVVTDAGAGLTLSLTNAGVSVHGDWRYKYRLGFVKIRDHGNFDVKVSRVSVRVSISMGADNNGRPTISTRSCSCSVGDVSVRFHGGASWLYNLFRKQVERPISNSIRSKLCQSIQKVINVNANRSLQKMKIRVPVEGLLTLDYRLVAPPVFGANFLESLHKAEFFWTTSQREAPFQPEPIGDLPPPLKMATFSLSDYVFNSLGYAIFTYGSQFLKYELTQADLPARFRHFLNTSIVPQIAEKYPGSTIEIAMYATRAPNLQTNIDKIIGRLRGNANFNIRLATGALISWFTIDVKSLIVVSGRITDKKITAEVKHFGFETNVTKIDVRPVPAAVIKFVFNMAANQFIIPKLNGVGKKGMPLPALDNVQFVNPELHLIKDAVCFTTDLKYNP